jgi:hypothetical protein
MLTVPALLLAVFYGASSPYAAITAPVRLLAVAWMASYIADMICAYVVGASSPRLALLVNGAGTAAIAMLAVPMAAAYSVIGLCGAVLIANLTRVAFAKFALDRVLLGDRQTSIPQSTSAA